MGGTGSHQVVLKSGGQTNPNLKTTANLAILYKLHGEAKLTGDGILDYLPYMTKVCQLVQRYNLVSVLLYDREYRKLLCAHDFQWDTYVPHLDSVYLQPRIPCPNNPLSKPQLTSSPSPWMIRCSANSFNTKGGYKPIFKEASF